PSVIASTPEARNCRYCEGVIPAPPAAFSALAMTRSSRSAARSAGTARRTSASPGEPTISPRKSRRIPSHAEEIESRLLRCLHTACLSNHSYLDLARVVELLLDRAG